MATQAMNITKARAEAVAGHPILRLEIDGHSATVVDPDQTLLDSGIVILLDDTGHWQDTLSEVYGDEHGNHAALPSATRDPQILDLVRRFNAGENGDLLGRD